MRNFLLAVVVLLTGCAALNLDTTNKRFAAFEISYKSMLTEVDQLDKSDSLRPETKARLRGSIADVKNARAAAYVAKGTGNILEAQNQLALAIKLLDALKANLPKDAKI